MKINFEYSPIFDQHISQIMGTLLDEKKTIAVNEMISTLNEEWKKRGAILLHTACNLSGFSFKQSEMKGIVTVSDFVSMSHPLIINVKKYIEKFDIDSLIEVVFHEVLHILLTDNWKVWPTVLLKEHGCNNRTIETHLHLMSLEKATHLELENYQCLKDIGLWYQKIGGPYQKAWAIIEENENFRLFINELKDNTQWGQSI